MKNMRIKSLMLQLLLLVIVGPPVLSQDLKENPELDRKVKAFLEEKQYRWRDMFVPPRRDHHKYHWYASQ